jgi:hypothetical protein
MYFDDEFDLLKESLNDTANGGEIYFEASKFIDSLKNKFKKDDTTDIKSINYGKVMKVAKAYTEMRLGTSRVKLALVKDSNVKGTSEYRTLQKKAVTAEKEYRKLKKDLNEEELNVVNNYISGFESTFDKKIQAQIADIKAAKKVVIAKEYAEYADDREVINILTESVNDDFYMEGVNWDIHKKYREDLGVAKKNIRECIKHIKAHDYEKAREILKSTIKTINECKENAIKEIDKIDDSKIITAICGLFLRTVSVFCRDILLLVVCAPVAAVRELIDTIKDISNVSKKYQEKGYFKPGDFNTYVQFVKKDYDKIVYCLESFLSVVDKIEKEYNDKHKEDVKSESCKTEGCHSEVVTEKNIDSDMKPLIEKLHKKGYKTIASSSGHANVIAKDDSDKDNIRDGHHYGDARLVFGGKYNFGKAPKYWYWKKVDNADEVEYLDIEQISGKESPNTSEKFHIWKNNYMKSLTDWIDELPDISGEKKEEVEEACQKESVIDLDIEIDTLFESVMSDLELDIFDI